MNTRIVGLFAALLLVGVAAPAFAQAATPATKNCQGPAFTWQRLGGDPFAATEAEAVRKLPEVLARMVSMGCLPQAVADNFAAQVRSNPEGGRTTIVPGSHLAYMESGKHPILNVTVGRNVVSAASGLVVAIEAKTWRAIDQATGIVYTFGMPFVCHNWFVVITPPTAQPQKPPVREPDCVVSNRDVNHETDEFVHIVAFRIDRDDVCTAWRYAGETEWRRVTNCDTDCYYDQRFRAVAKDKIGNADMTFTMKVPVVQTGTIQVRVSKRVLDSSSGMALADCLELISGRMSDSVYTIAEDYVHYSEFNQHIATIFRTQSSIPADYEARDRYFRFSNSR